MCAGRKVTAPPVFVMLLLHEYACRFCVLVPFKLNVRFERNRRGFTPALNIQFQTTYRLFLAGKLFEVGATKNLATHARTSARGDHLAKFPSPENTSSVQSYVLTLRSLQSDLILLSIPSLYHPLSHFQSSLHISSSFPESLNPPSLPFSSLISHLHISQNQSPDRLYLAGKKIQILF